MSTTTNAATSSDLIDRIRQLIYDCGPTLTKHDQALVAIKTCIEEGVDTKARIISVLCGVGFNAGHVANILNPRKSPFTTADHWRSDASGRYVLHEASRA
jgi:hypothetical protein